MDYSHGWRALLLLALVLPGLLGGCGRTPAPDSGETVTVVFKRGKLFGDPRALDGLIAGFEARHPGVRVVQELLPSGTDEQHQFYVINLRAGAADFDVFAIDVIWAAPFARAGWLQDLSHLLPAAERAAIFPATMEAVTVQGRVYALPWFIDAGVLYYRADLLARHGHAVPATWEALAATAADIARREGLYGFVWQGKQYEGLVTNVLEYLWSNGGAVLDGERVVIDSPANRAALGFVVDLVQRRGVTPAFVTTLTEEPARRIFGDGNAVFLRNWPYAWPLFERPGSAVRGRVGVAPLPSFPGHAPAPTLGGWQLAVNPKSRHPEAAEQFARFMTSAEAQRALALAYGFQPPLMDLYRDPELRAAHPFLGELFEVFANARPRPVTPYYALVSQVLQAEFSAAVAGVKTPEAALAAAQRELDAIFARER